MNKTYISPSMVVVKLQHHSIICQSGPADSVQTHDEVGSSYQFTRESSSVWDEEW